MLCDGCVAIDRAAEVTGSLVEDAWLSTVMERPCLIVPPAAEWGDRQWLRTLARRKVFVTAKLSPLQVEPIRELEHEGFRFVEVAATFSGSTTGVQDPGRATVRLARPSDMESVALISEQAFTHTRFHRDPVLPSALASRIKREWAANFFRGTRGNTMVVAEEGDGRIGGFALFIFGADGSIVLDLIAVAPKLQRRGFARAMVAHAARIEVGTMPAKVLRVGTQAANDASVRLYQRLGLELSDTKVVLHHHGNDFNYPSGESHEDRHARYRS